MKTDLIEKKLGFVSFVKHMMIYSSITQLYIYYNMYFHSFRILLQTAVQIKASDEIKSYFIFKTENCAVKNLIGIVKSGLSSSS